MTNKEKLNELLTFTVENINDDNRTSALAFIKDFIIPGLCKEEIKDNIIQPEQIEPVSLPIESKKDIPEKPEINSDIPKGSLNGHKASMKRKLEEQEKDFIRSQFINLNGIIYEDVCIKIHKELGKEVTIFQVTGFITLLHRYVAKGEIELRDMGSYLTALDERRQGILTTKPNKQVRKKASNILQIVNAGR